MLFVVSDMICPVYIAPIIIPVYRGAKKYIYILRNTEAIVRLNQKCLDTDGNQFEHLLQLQKLNVTCIHLLLSV